MLVSDMRRQGDIHIVKPAISHKIGAADELLLGGRSKDFQSPLQSEFLH